MYILSHKAIQHKIFHLKSHSFLYGLSLRLEVKKKNLVCAVGKVRIGPFWKKVEITLSLRDEASELLEFDSFQVNWGSKKVVDFDKFHIAQLFEKNINSTKELNSLKWIDPLGLFFYIMNSNSMNIPFQKFNIFDGERYIATEIYEKELNLIALEIGKNEIIEIHNRDELSSQIKLSFKKIPIVINVVKKS